MLEGYGELPREQIWIFNFFRFHPVLNAMEFFSGAVLGSVVAEKTDADTTPVVGSNPLIHQTSLLMFACLSCILIRTLIPLNDLLFRSLIFLPLFLLWLRSAVLQPPDLLSRWLGHAGFVYLGKMSFCIFVLHGALGQLFFKRAVRKLLGFPPPSWIRGYFWFT